jgi:hypothetical protein
MLLLACESGPASKAPQNWDGLEKRDVKGLGAVYVRPNVQFKPYQKVMLDPVQVEFSKDWNPNSSRDVGRRLDSQDLQKIKETLAGLFREGFSRELSKGGYALTETPDEDAIRVSAALVDLYINAPDIPSPGRVRTYTTETGSVTLAMEVRDAPSGQLLARVVDRRRGNDAGGRLQWTNSVTNRAAAEQIIAVWAGKLRAGLDKLNGKPD